MATIKLPHNWRPRPDQLALWSYLEHGGRLAVEIAHRRWGKDDVALHRTACAAFERVATYWHMLPEAKQARKAIWTAINPHTGKRRIDEAFPLEIRDNTNDTEMFIRFKNGSTWQVVGSDNFDSLVGSPPAGVVFSEWALADPRAWGYFRPIWRENKGWALFITTPRGPNHARSTLQLAESNPEYFAQIVTAEQTSVFSAAELAEERQELIKEYGKEFGTAMFEQEYNCSFNAAIIGAYYGYLVDELRRKGLVTDFEYDPSIPVHTFWDLGLDDHMAIWFVQFAGSEVRWLDYESGGGVGIEDYIEIVKAKPYQYGTHFGPHDLRVRELTRGNLSRIEVAKAMGIKFEIVPELSIADGRQALRGLLKRSIFHKSNTVNGLSGLQSHRAKWDPETKKLSNHPVNDWTCHPADAARYVAVTWKEVFAKQAVDPKAELAPDKFLFFGDEHGTITTRTSARAFVERKLRAQAED